jgi:hypothetical protein
MLVGDWFFTRWLACLRSSLSNLHEPDIDDADLELMFDRIDERIISMDNQMEKNCKMLENKADEIVRGMRRQAFSRPLSQWLLRSINRIKPSRNGLKGTISFPRMRQRTVSSSNG